MSCLVWLQALLQLLLSYGDTAYSQARTTRLPWDKPPEGGFLC